MKQQFKLKLICALCAPSVFAATPDANPSAPVLLAQQHTAKLYGFDARGLFGRSNKDIDLNHFSSSQAMPAGTYSLNTRVNQNQVGQLSVVFDHLDASTGAVLCIDAELLKRMDLRESVLAGLSAEKCHTIHELSPDAYYDYDRSTLSLDISLPLNITQNRPAGYISPALFDSGVTSAYLNYDYNFYKDDFNASEQDHQRTQTHYLSLAGGMNYAGFNFRHAGQFQSEQNSNLGRYHAYLNAISTDILPLQSRLMLGDFNSSGNHIDSAYIRGLQLSSDVNMRPMSQRSYAPLIQGMANTNALVSIFQNGRKIYERTVPAGTFEINDLTAISNNGDLQVQVTENGGEQHQFIVPMQGNLNLVRVNQLNYSVAAGQYKLNNKTLNDVIGQASVEYGLNNYLSAYASTNLSQPYQSYLLGLGINTVFGGLNLDLQHAQASLNDHRQNGQKYNLGYQYHIAGLGSTLNISGQYQSQSFMSLGNTLSLRNDQDLNQAESDNLYRTYQLKQQLNISLYQTLFAQRYGSLYLRGSQNKYWHAHDNLNQYDVGYSNRWNQVSYSLGFNQSHTLQQDNRKQQRIYLSLSLPLDVGRRRAQLNSNLQHSHGEQRQSTSNIGFSGLAGDHNQLSYGVSSLNSWGDAGSNSTLSSHLNLRLPQIQLGLTSSLNKDDQQYGLSASGALVAHPYGITASNEQSETFTIIHADNAKGAEVINAWGGKIDRFGNAIYPNLSAYDINSIGLDSKNLPVDLQLKSNQSQVIPRRYSATMVEFQTQTTSNILLNVRLPQDQKIPIGTRAQDASGRVLGMFGQSNQLFIEDPQLLHPPAQSKQSAENPSKNKLIWVKWGQAEDAICRFLPPELSAKPNAGVFQVIDVECQE